MSRSNPNSRSTQSDKTGTAGDWLRRDLGFGKLRAHTERLLAIQNTLSTELGLSFVSVGGVESGEITLIIHNAAQAAKLRQREPEILKTLVDAGWDFNRIKVRPQTRHDPRAAPRPAPRKALPLAAVTEIEKSLGALPEGPIKSALESLLKNASRN